MGIKIVEKSFHKVEFFCKRNAKNSLGTCYRMISSSVGDWRHST